MKETRTTEFNAKELEKIIDSAKSLKGEIDTATNSLNQAKGKLEVLMTELSNQNLTIETAQAKVGELDEQIAKLTSELNQSSEQNN